MLSHIIRVTTNTVHNLVFLCVCCVCLYAILTVSGWAGFVTSKHVSYTTHVPSSRYLPQGGFIIYLHTLDLGGHMLDSRIYGANTGCVMYLPNPWVLLNVTDDNEECSRQSTPIYFCPCNGITYLDLYTWFAHQRGYLIPNSDIKVSCVMFVSNLLPYRKVAADHKESDSSVTSIYFKPLIWYVCMMIIVNLLSGTGVCDLSEVCGSFSLDILQHLFLVTCCVRCVGANTSVPLGPVKWATLLCLYVAEFWCIFHEVMVCRAKVYNCLRARIGTQPTRKSAWVMFFDGIHASAPVGIYDYFAQDVLCPSAVIVQNMPVRALSVLSDGDYGKYVPVAHICTGLPFDMVIHFFKFGCWHLEGPAFHILYGILFCLGGSLNAYMVQGPAVSTDPYSVGVPRPATVMSPLIHECTRTFQELTILQSEVGCRIFGGSVYYALNGTHLRVYSDMTTFKFCGPDSSSSLHTVVMVRIAAPLPSPILNLPVRALSVLSDGDYGKYAPVALFCTGLSCDMVIHFFKFGCWLLEGPAFHILYGILFCLGGSLNAYMVQGSAVSTDPYSVGVPRPATVMSSLIHECTRTFQELTTLPSEVGCRVSGGSVYYTLYGTHLRVYSDMTTLKICRPGSSSSLHTDVMVRIAAPLPSPILNLSRSQFGENEFFDECYWRMLIMVGLDLRYSRLGTKKSK